MENDRVMIYSTNKLYEAEIIRKIMGDNSISAFLVNKMDSFYKFGEIEIHILREDVIRAKKLIQEYEQQ